MDSEASVPQKINRAMKLWSVLPGRDYEPAKDRLSRRNDHDLRAFRRASFALLFTACTVFAQNSGTIVGNVHDTSGAQIEGATITVANVEKGTSQTAVSGSDGEYVVPFLPAGPIV